MVRTGTTSGNAVAAGKHGQETLCSYGSGQGKYTYAGHQTEPALIPTHPDGEYYPRPAVFYNFYADTIGEKLDIRV